MDWSIGEVAKRLGVNKSTLINWEALGYIPKAKRRLRTKARYWTEAQVEAIRQFYRCGYMT